MHECPKCNKRFTYIRDFKRHINRKYPCNGIKHQCNFCNKTYTTSSGLSKHKKRCKNRQPKNNQNQPEEQPKIDKQINMPIDPIITKNNTKLENKNISKIEIKPKKNKRKLDVNIKCEYCNKEFSYKQSYYRHKKHRCKIYKRILQQESVFPESTRIPIHNHTYQYTKTHDSHMNNYGEEDLEWLKENFFDVLERSENIRNLSDFVKFGFEQIHCNPNRIENHNVSIASKKDYFDKGIMSIYRNDGWRLEENHKVIKQSIRRFANLMEEQVDEQISDNILPEEFIKTNNIQHSVSKMMDFIQSFDDGEIENHNDKLFDDVKGGVYVMVDNFKQTYPCLEKKEIHMKDPYPAKKTIIKNENEPDIIIESVTTQEFKLSDMGKFVDHIPNK